MGMCVTLQAILKEGFIFNEETVMNGIMTNMEV